MAIEKVDIAVLKTLRAMTGAGIGECKKALIESAGDIEQAKKFLRGFAKIKAEKKASRVTPEGSYALAITPTRCLGCVIEVRCETDFVSRHETFQEAVQLWANRALAFANENKELTLSQLKEYLEEQRIELVQKTDENIQISQFYLIEGENLISYQHGNGKICLIAAIHSSSSQGKNDSDIFQKLSAQLALGSAPALFYDPAGQFSLRINGALESISTQEKSVWRDAPLFSDEGQTLGQWLDSVQWDVRGYARFILSASNEDLGQKFNQDVQTLLSKYGESI